MLIKILVTVLVVLGVLAFYRKWSVLDAQKRKKLALRTLSAIVIAVLVVSVLTGRVGALFGFIGAAIAIAIRYLPILIRYFPVLAALKARYSKSEQGDTPSSKSNQDMSKEEARACLGVSAQASREEIIQAHRKLMQQHHPDRGGDVEIAAKINRAKDVLLSDSKTSK